MNVWFSWLSPLAVARSVILGVFLVSATSTGFAETLALHDGQRIETKGPWQVEGRRITYTALNGTFSALRSSLVDLDKSRELSNPAPVQASEQEQPASVGLVVRQSDIRRSTDGGAPEEPTSGPAVPQGSIGVSNWDEVLVTQGTKITGTLRNATINTYLALRLEVSLVADNGDILAIQPATLEKNWLSPTSELSFEITFPDVFAFTNATFEVKGSPVKPPPTQDGPGSSEETTTDPDDTPTGSGDPPG